MAVSNVNDQTGSGGGKRFLVGTNVVFAIVLVVAIVVVAQMIAYAVPVRVDMTSSRINSLSDSTEGLLRNLEQNVRITSLYFETDREEKDQPRYRQGAKNLIDLYEATNRGKITAEWVNPLKDLDKFQRLSARLRELPAFKEGIDAHQARIDAFHSAVLPKLQELMQKEMQDAAAAASGGIAGETATPAARIELTFRQLQTALDATKQQVEGLAAAANPQYSAAVNELRSFYPQISKALTDIGKFGSEVIRQVPDLPPQEASFLQSAGNRYADAVALIEGENTKLQELESPKLDTILSQLVPTGNAIVVETAEDAQVVDFTSVWPAIDPAMGSMVPFDKRAFKGEQELTAAILRATHKEQTAVIFVRYGGQPLFMGGFMPNQPGAPFTAMKEQLEDANFVVEEWDLKTTETPPTIDPPPTETLFVVLKPQGPDQNAMMGRQPQEPPFSEKQRELLMKAMGENPRALFIAGWHPGPFGPIPGTYEYDEYLSKNWGIDVETGTVVLSTIAIGPGKFGATREAFNIADLETGDHPIVNSALAAQLVLPWSAPLTLSSSPPDGVQIDTLVSAPRMETVWGVKDITKYQQQLQSADHLTMEPTDSQGPFVLAAAATKGDARIVVVSSREFAEDGVAFARAMSFTPQGISLRSRNPGNVLLLINSLHWLSGNTEFMNIGQPIDSAVLAIPDSTTVKAVQVLTIFAWPALALIMGGAVWLVRRR